MPSSMPVQYINTDPEEEDDEQPNYLSASSIAAPPMGVDADQEEEGLPADAPQAVPTVVQPIPSDAPQDAPAIVAPIPPSTQAVPPPIDDGTLIQPPSDSEAIPPASADLPGITPNDTSQSAPPTAADARARAAVIVGQRPVRPKVGWLRTLASIGAGLGAGYANSTGKKNLPHTDVAALMDNIKYGGYNNKIADWQNQVDDATAAAKQLEAGENDTDAAQTAQQNVQKTALAAANAKALQTAQILYGVKNEKDYTAAYPQLQAVNPELAHKLSPFYVPDRVTSALNGVLPLPDQMKQQVNTSEINRNNAEAQWHASQSDTAKTTAARNEAETKRTNTENAIQQIQLDAINQIQSNPQAAQQDIDVVVDPQKYPQWNSAAKAEYNALLSRGAKPADAWKESVGKYANNAAEVEKEINPTVQKSKVDQAVAVERATAPMKSAEAVATQRALYGNNAALAEVPPHLAQNAVNAYEKIGQDYATKIAAGKQLQDFVSAAQSGNKAAPGMIPIAELRQVVNRVNRNELESVGKGAGSTLDKVQGWLGGATEGQPIPPEVLSGINSLSDVMQSAATREYGYKVQTVNQSYGSKFQPVVLGGGRTVNMRAPNGQIKPVPESEVDHFKKLGAVEVQ